MSDLYIDIIYPINTPEKYEIKTNMKSENVKDALCEYIHGIIGYGGKDTRKAREIDVYHITIDIDLSCDKFSVKSDTDNNGLTDGIIMDVISRMED
jgi:hypothetical protein